MIHQGSIVLVRFGYSDLTHSKIRPALVLSGPEFFQTYGDIVVAAVSSKPPRNEYEVALAQWREAGLRLPSRVICGKLVTVLASLATEIGQLREEDLARVKCAVRSVFDL